MVLGGVVIVRLDVSTDMTRFMPSSEARGQAHLMRQFATSELSRTMLLVVGAPSPQAAVSASRAFEEALRRQPAVGRNLAFLEGGPPKGLDRAFWELYQPRRLAFLAENAASARALLTREGLTQAAESLKDRLATPMSTLIARAAPSDPLMITASMMDGLQPTRAAALAVAEGRFMTADGRHAVLFLGTTASAFDAVIQGPVLDGIRAAFDSVNAAAGDALTLQQSGVNRLAVAAQASIKKDIQRVSVISVLSVVVLFMLLFGSLRLVAVTLVPITAGIVAGVAGCLLLFGSIHGLTLAFGAALIGVCIDYCAHTYCHHQLEGDPDGARGTVRKVWGGLALGATTTITGFVALGGATFPGLQEVGVFGALGVGAALAATRWLVPPLMGSGGAARPRLIALSAGLERLLAAARRQRVVLTLLPLGCLVVVAMGIPKMGWNDDLSEFGRVGGPLVEEDETVRAMVAPFEQRRFVLSIGDDDEAALVANDAVVAHLRAARAAGELTSFRSVAQLLRSKATQQHVSAVARSPDTDLWRRLHHAFAGAGFNAALFAPFKATLEAQPPAALTYSELAASPLAAMVRPFRVTLGDRVGFVTFLTGLDHPAAVERRLAGVDGAQLLDFGAVMTDAYGGYRRRMIELLLLGLAAVVMVVALRYRDLRLTVAALAPSLLAAATTLSVLTMAGLPLSVLTVTALLMVVCIGVDYGVFLAETARGNVRLGPTMAALVVAAVSTLLGFGLLSLSDHPSLMSLGLTAAIGVGASVILAPTTLILMGAGRAEA